MMEYPTARDSCSRFVGATESGAGGRAGLEVGWVDDGVGRDERVQEQAEGLVVKDHVVVVAVEWLVGEVAFAVGVGRDVGFPGFELGEEGVDGGGGVVVVVGGGGRVLVDAVDGLLDGGLDAAEADDVDEGGEGGAGGGGGWLFDQLLVAGDGFVDVEGQGDVDVAVGNGKGTAHGDGDLAVKGVACPKEAFAELAFEAEAFGDFGGLAVETAVDGGQHGHSAVCPGAVADGVAEAVDGHEHQDRHCARVFAVEEDGVEMRQGRVKVSFWVVVAGLPRRLEKAAAGGIDKVQDGQAVGVCE